MLRDSIFSLFPMIFKTKSLGMRHIVVLCSIDLFISLLVVMIGIYFFGLHELTSALPFKSTTGIFVSY